MSKSKNKVEEVKVEETEVLEEETVEENTEELNETEVEEKEESKMAKFGNFMKKKVLPTLGKMAVGAIVGYGLGYVSSSMKSSDSNTESYDSNDDGYTAYLNDQDTDLGESTYSNTDYAVNDIIGE